MDPVQVRFVSLQVRDISGVKAVVEVLPNLEIGRRRIHHATGMALPLDPESVLLFLDTFLESPQCQ